MNSGIVTCPCREMSFRRSTTDRQGDHLEVERKTPVFDVPDVEGELLVPRDGIPAVDLRPAGQPRHHVMPARLLERVALEVLHEERARAYQAELTSSDVQELRKLIEARCPQKPPERREPLVIGKQRPVRTPRLTHGAKLHDAERPGALSRSLLTEQHGASHVETNRRGDGQQNWGKHE